MWAILYQAGLLAILLTSPGWAMLTVSGLRGNHGHLHRWCLAVALSVAFYPILFYTSRQIGIPVGTTGLRLILLLSTALTIWRWHASRSWPLRLDGWEWLAVVLFGVTLAWRVSPIASYHYPAWADSLHHVLLTKLTVEQRGLPTTLAPYWPIPLEQYHLGLYALTGSYALLSKLPAHTALFVMSQVLNGLSAIGAYAIVRAFSGRRGAAAAVGLVGLVFAQPGDYVNLGRSSQLVANFLVLPALYFVVASRTRAGGGNAPGWPERRAGLLAAVLIAATILCHFRVGTLLVLLILADGAVACIALRSAGAVRCVAVTHAAVTAAAVLLALPGIVPAMAWHVLPRLHIIGAAPISLAALLPDALLSASYRAQMAPLLESPNLALLLVTSLGAGVLVRRRDPIGGVLAVWVLFTIAFLFVETLSPALDVIAPGVPILMLYLPAGVMAGMAIETLCRRLPDRRVAPALVAAAALAAWLGPRPTEQWRFFMTAADRRAMDWIAANTPADAVFGVNTVFWNGIAHGTDGGYWIPYFTNRSTTTGCLLPGQFWYYRELSRLVLAIQHGDDRVAELKARGVGYIYLGANGNYAGGLQRITLRKNPELTLVYEWKGVAIFEIRRPPAVAGGSAVQRQVPGTQPRVR
jgi:hypothetical protein